MSPLPPTESARLQARPRYQGVDSEAQPVLDEFARLAATLCGTPIALIALIGEARVHFLAKVEWNFTDMPREGSFWAQEITQDGTFIVPDAIKDPRFATNRLVIGDPKVRFYAGVPLLTPRGQVIGTL